MPYPGRNNIYEAIIKRMVKEALEAQEQEFANNRSADSEEQLLDYLRFCAQRLGHTPWPSEIVGGGLIASRFGSWENALASAKLPKPRTQDKMTSFTRYLDETERQKALYRERKAAKKQLSQQRQMDKQSV